MLFKNLNKFNFNFSKVYNTQRLYVKKLFELFVFIGFM